MFSRARCGVRTRSEPGGELGFLCEASRVLSIRTVPFGQPERQAGADVVIEGEQLEFAPEFAMVAFAGLFEHREVGFELGFVFESGAVDALELRILFVALVVGARDLGQFECPDVAGAHDVGAGAEVDKSAVAEQRDLLVLGDVGDDVQLELVGSCALGEGGEAALLSRARGLRRG